MRLKIQDLLNISWLCLDQPLTGITHCSMHQHTYHILLFAVHCLTPAIAGWNIHKTSWSTKEVSAGLTLDIVSSLIVEKGLPACCLFLGGVQVMSLGGDPTCRHRS